MMGCDLWLSIAFAACSMLHDAAGLRFLPAPSFPFKFVFGILFITTLSSARRPFFTGRSGAVLFAAYEYKWRFDTPPASLSFLFDTARTSASFALFPEEQKA